MAGRIWTPRWMITTLIVIAALGVLIRLGFWQLERARERQNFNHRVQAQLNQPALEINQANGADLPDMEYRQATARGMYLNEEAVLLRNQVRDGNPGYHLLVPLRLEGSQQAVLVNRGWIPMEDADPDRWQKYDLPGTITVEGVIRRSTPPGRYGLIDPPLAEGQSRMDVWNRATIERIAGQVSLPLLPVYLQEKPSGDPQVLPAPALVELDLSEGPHQGYALQWFTFAAILAAGYPFYVRRSLQNEIRAETAHVNGGLVK